MLWIWLVSPVYGFNIQMMNVPPAEIELIIAHILFGALRRFLNSSLANSPPPTPPRSFSLCAPDNFVLAEAVRALSVV